MRSSRCVAFLVVVGVMVVPAASAKTLPVRNETKHQAVKTTTLISEATVQTWVCQDKLVALGVLEGRSQFQSAWSLPKSEKYRKWVLKQRVHRQASCLKRLHRFAFEWNWQAFPQWVISLARCESSVNWFAEGSSRDGLFYSAFNIGRSRYDDAAHRMGVRGWHEGPGVPSPYEQAMAVIGYVRIHGDGFTGRCHGIARSSWE